MTPQLLLRILRARSGVVIAALLATVLTTLLISVLLPKQFVAKTAVLIDVKSKSATRVAGTTRQDQQLHQAGGTGWATRRSQSAGLRRWQGQTGPEAPTLAEPAGPAKSARSVALNETTAAATLPSALRRVQAPDSTEPTSLPPTSVMDLTKACTALARLLPRRATSTLPSTRAEIARSSGASDAAGVSRMIT